MRTADVLVVGGGVMGLSIAFQLARRGKAGVVLLETGQPGRGESGKSTAILRQHYSHALTARLAKHGIEFFSSEFRELTGSDPGHKRTGMLVVAGPKDGARLRLNVERLSEAGIETKLLSAKDLKGVSFDAAWEESTVAAFEPDAGYVNPWSVLKGLEAGCRQAGVEVRTGERVTALSLHNGRVVGVRTSRGLVSAGTVVLAAGPWSAKLARSAGLKLPLKVTRPQVASYYFGDARGRGLVFADLGRDAYWLPNPGGLTLVGGLDLRKDAPVADPDRAPEHLEPRMIGEFRRRVAGRVPSFASAIYRGGYGALYTLSPDLHPLVGRSGLEGLVLAVGFSGHGFKLSPAVGLAVAELVADGSYSTFDLSPFRPDRFKAGTALGSAYSNVLA